MIELKNICVSKSGRKILENISVKFPENKITVIMGPSGAGKSSILKVILGLWKPDKGKVIINDTNISSLKEEELFSFRREIAMVFQNNALFDSLTVGENIAYFLRENELASESEIKSTIRECLEFVNLAGSENLYPAEISGGMKKRVAIARAIAIKPKIIMYDEPTTGLDPINTKIILNLIKKIQKRGTSSFVVSHLLHDAVYLGDYFLFISDGKLIGKGNFRDIIEIDDATAQDFVSELFDEVALLKNNFSELLTYA